MARCSTVWPSSASAARTLASVFQSSVFSSALKSWSSVVGAMASNRKSAGAELSRTQAELSRALKKPEEELASHGREIELLRQGLATKASASELPPIFEQLPLFALREETFGQLEKLKNEATARARLLKDRLDRTDRELVRQVEESEALDTSERYESLLKLIDSKVRDGPLPARYYYCTTTAILLHSTAILLL